MQKETVWIVLLDKKFILSSWRDVELFPLFHSDWRLSVTPEKLKLHSNERPLWVGSRQIKGVNQCPLSLDSRRSEYSTLMSA